MTGVQTCALPISEQAYTEANLDPALQEALDSLAPDFKVAVVLCDVVGMSYDEIADTLGGKNGDCAFPYPPRPVPAAGRPGSQGRSRQ